MQTLLDKSRINKSRLQSVLLKILSTDVNNLAMPCYLPPLKITMVALLKAVGLVEKDVKDFIKRTYKGTKAEKFLVVKQPDANLMLFIMWWALKNNQKTLFRYAMMYHMVRQYAHRFSTHWPKKYCSEDVFSYSLENIVKTHLFAREKTIANALSHIAKDMERLYFDDIKQFKVDGIIAFIQASRTRIAQSVKSFAEHYYASYNSGSALNTQQDGATDDENDYQHSSQIQERGKKVVDAAVKRLIVYKNVDRNAVEDAKKITKVKTEVANLITTNVKDIKYADEIRLILQLFVKEVSDKSMFCGDKFQPLVKRLMGLKRIRARIYFKQQIYVLLLRIFKDTGYSKTYQQYTSQTQFVIASYLAFYLTMSMRNMVC